MRHLLKIGFIARQMLLSRKVFSSWHKGDIFVCGFLNAVTCVLLTAEHNVLKKKHKHKWHVLRNSYKHERQKIIKTYFLFQKEGHRTELGTQDIK